MKREIIIRIVEYLRNVANGFLGYISCTFMLMGMFYINYLSGTMKPSVYSETTMNHLFNAVGYLFVVFALMGSVLNAIVNSEWAKLLSKIVAVTVVIFIMYSVPDIIKWISTAGVNGNFWLVVGLFTVSMILKFVLQALDKDGSITATAVSHVRIKED